MTTRKNLHQVIVALSALAALGVAVTETPRAEAQTPTFTVLHSFCTQSGCPDGIEPQAPLVQASDGSFYGVTLFRPQGGSVFRLTSDGTLTTLYNFCAQWGCPDGQSPEGLIKAADGNFYGVTARGGTGAYCTNNPGGCGTLFRITPTGALTTLYNFCSQIGCPNGGMPLSSLVQAEDGNFYGATYVGGSGSHCPQYDGCGTIYRMTPSGKLTTLHNFCSEVGCTEGFGASALIEALDGNFYGTISNGGTGAYCPLAGTCGTIFRITPSGTFSTLHNFCSLSGCADGQRPTGGLTQGADGNLYGATIAGGTGAYCTLASTEGCGILYRITPEGNLTSLYSLCSQPGCADGNSPFGSLILGYDGNFYGTMSSGGKPVPQWGGWFTGGTVFRITPSGTLSTLYTFCSQVYCRDGWSPRAGVIQATDGSLYGTTCAGGSTAEVCTTAPGCTGDGWGSVFRLVINPFLPVTIRINPTTINLRSNAKIKVAILSTSMFDATSVVPDSVTLSGALVDTEANGTPLFSFDDVNKDGILDLVLTFRARDLQLTKADKQVVLKGQTFAGQLIKGAAPVRIVPLSAALMYTSQKTRDGKSTGYGMGWESIDQDGVKGVAHAGGQSGTSTELFMEPDKGFAIALMCNLQGAQLGELAHSIVKIVLQ